MPYLRPDGKSQVSVEYVDGKPKRIDAVVVSTQHDDDVTTDELRADVKKYIIDAVVPSSCAIHRRSTISIPPAGSSLAVRTGIPD